jgi:predicted nucleotidyltransferase
MIALVQNKMNDLKTVCQLHAVSRLFLFGSAARGDFNGQSDLDFAVLFSEKLSPLEQGDSFFSLKDDLEGLFGREIDLVSYRVIKNPIFKEELDKTKITLYAA